MKLMDLSKYRTFNNSKVWLQFYLDIEFISIGITLCLQIWMFSEFLIKQSSHLINQFDQL